MGLLLVTAVVDAAAIGVDLMEYALLSQGVQALSEAEAVANDTRQAVMGSLQVLLLLGTAPFFITWFYRAYGNLPRLGVTQPRFGRGWAVGGWFVPFLNVIRPKQLANDIWRASDPAADLTATPLHELPVGWVVHAWWAAWLVANVLGNVFWSVWTNPDLALLTGTRVVTAFDLSSLILDVLAVRFVLQVTSRTERRMETAPLEYMGLGAPSTVTQTPAL